jgi:hypothetical protein
MTATRTSLTPPDVAERFRDDTANHEMTVLHEDGLYRHLRFKAPATGMYWFDLITWPGNLAINGDMGAFTFARMEDMFSFFRGTRINPQYWAEKVRAGREGLEVYDEDLFRRLVVEHFVDAVKDRDAPHGLGRAVREQILGNEDIYFEHGAHTILAEFEYEGFRFHDTFEWDLRAYSHQFLWCLHAIQWGIGVYDARHGQAQQPPAQIETVELPA